MIMERRQTLDSKHKHSRSARLALGVISLLLGLLQLCAQDSQLLLMLHVAGLHLGCARALGCPLLQNIRSASTYY